MIWRHGTVAEVAIIGGGLAGSECALQLARRGVRVRLVEERPGASTGAHRTPWLAELVCSNSLKSERSDSAAGLLKAELELLDSRLLAIARANRVEAGGALAVDREAFALAVTRAVEEEPLISLERQEQEALPEGPAVVATGPLTSPALASALEERLGARSLSFFDAAAPIVDADTIDRTIAFSQNRYEGGEGSGNYLNCPMDKAEYAAFIDALLEADRVILRSFETKDLFSACQPIEEVARAGRDAPRFGALKPVGLTDPRTGTRPWAVVQLRAENAQRSAYNLVGFQTNLTFAAQRHVFRMIPGLEHAEFFRYGVMHRNSFVDAPHVLEKGFKVPGMPVWLAGQITGTEGYTEAISSGLYAALNVVSALRGLPQPELPATGAFGSLVAWASDPATANYQPQHVNFGLMPPLDDPIRNKRERHAAFCERALRDLTSWKEAHAELFREGAAS